MVQKFDSTVTRQKIKIEEKKKRTGRNGKNWNEKNGRKNDQLITTTTTTNHRLLLTEN
mgnify:FL=1